MNTKQGSGFRVQGSGFRVQGSGFRVQGSGLRVQGSGFRVQGSGFRIQGSGFMFKGSGFRIWGLRLKASGCGRANQSRRASSQMTPSSIENHAHGTPIPKSRVKGLGLRVEV
jgi:hypothetical protein